MDCKRMACITTMMGTVIWRTVGWVEAWPAAPRVFWDLMNKAMRTMTVKSANMYEMKEQCAGKSLFCGLDNRGKQVEGGTGDRVNGRARGS